MHKNYRSLYATTKPIEKIKYEKSNCCNEYDA